MEVWFNPQHGTLVCEDGTTPLPVPEDAVPLRELLLSEKFEIPDGTYERMSARGIDTEYSLAIGKLMVHAITAENEREPLTEEHMRRMHKLGLLPDTNYMDRRFGSLLNFQLLIGAERKRPSSMYDIMSCQQIYEDLFSAHAISGDGGPLTMQAIDLYHRFGLTPSYTYLYNRFGGVKRLNEYLDYPDVVNWDISDYVSYGASVLKHNGPDALTINNVEILGKQKYGPYPQAIKKRLGSWEVFKRLSAEEKQRLDALEGAKHQSIRAHFQQIRYGQLEPSDPTEKISCWAKFHVAANCISNTPNEILTELATMPTKDFVQALQQRDKLLTIAKIEIAAVALQVFDDIWPPLHKRIPKLA